MRSYKTGKVSVDDLILINNGAQVYAGDHGEGSGQENTSVVMQCPFFFSARGKDQSQ